MSQKLNSSMAVHRLAADLGLRSTENPVQVIMAYCHRTVKKFLAEYGQCKAVDALLDLLANKLGTRIVEVHDDKELQSIQREYVSRGEQIFATLDRELNDKGCFGITLKLQNPEPWEQQYISIIDCRGRKAQRKYHTKWHEIGHLLILTDQTRLAFRRTHDVYHPKSAEESLVDAIAGEFSFYRSILSPSLKGEITFQKIEHIRQTYCPEASTYSAILNVSKAWPSPVIWVEAHLATRKSESPTQQHQLSFVAPPQAVLRAVYTSPNDAARAQDFAMIPNFRVPKRSVIYKVFETGLQSEAFENLDWWESSGGTRLGARRVRVLAKKIGESVHALISPL
jgi:hypothetical protein